MAPVYETKLPPVATECTTLYTPWFDDTLNLLIADSDAEFLSTVILGLREETFDYTTAIFAESDLLLNGWHTADTAQPDRTQLHRFWHVLLTDRQYLERKY